MSTWRIIFILPHCSQRLLTLTLFQQPLVSSSFEQFLLSVKNGDRRVEGGRGDVTLNIAKCQIDAIFLCFTFAFRKLLQMTLHTQNLHHPQHSLELERRSMKIYFKGFFFYSDLHHILQRSQNFHFLTSFFSGQTTRDRPVTVKKLMSRDL